MDNKSNADNQEETPEDTSKINDPVRDNAGPSGSSLPGSVQSPKTRPGLSKSEHNLRQITTEDVTNALKSLSFGTPVSNFNLQELQDQSDESTTLLDIKKFMASCFKLNKDVVETPLQSVETRHIDVPEIPNASCNVQTECIPVKTEPNQVIVTGVEPKVSKEKKKNSGSLSERSDLAAAQRDSLSSIGSNVCRICMTRGRERVSVIVTGTTRTQVSKERNSGGPSGVAQRDPMSTALDLMQDLYDEGGRGRLISPCNCKGSLANVHLSCLERWLNQVGRHHCELCGFSYPAIRTPRYTVLQALRLWFGNPRNRSHLQSDCLIFWLLSTVTAGLLAVCIVGTQYFVIEGNKFGKLHPSAGNLKEEGISHRITETAMDFFMAIVLCGYSVTVYLLWKDHYVMWNRWRRANVNVRLLLAPDANPVPFTPRPRYNIV